MNMVMKVMMQYGNLFFSEFNYDEWMCIKELFSQ